MSNKANCDRTNNLISFICINYCQFCDNKCNASDVMEKYQNNCLTTTQMAEVDKFQLDKVTCKNHIPNDGFTMFGHIIVVHYSDGRIKENEDMVSTETISQLWNNEYVDDIEIVFSDV